ncbi:unnamed protein product [Prunus armeniaca]|uniref:Uncharacterized protein n=1 Tax=Prunus armeniaca TaxID=36596 RepID=A0A6J5VCX3_PRUAR|nr:unnamed protein product [Prunus armeniaca]
MPSCNPLSLVVYLRHGYPQNTVSGMSYPAAAEGGLTYMPGQAHSSQIPNVPTQGPVASIGGNPFA